MKTSIKALMAVAMIAAMNPSFGQSFPSRPVQVIMGDGAGGPFDIIVRRAATIADKRLGQSIVIDQRPGAQNSIAANAVANAAPDGYTLFSGSITTYHPLFLKNNSLVALKVFSPVSNLAVANTFVFTSAKSPFSSFPQMIAYAKANPGKLNHGSNTPSCQIQMMILSNRTGITFTHIPYKTVGEAVAALISGEIDVTAATSLGAYVSALKAGTVRAMMAVGPKRSAVLPNVPTSGELGIANYAQSANLGLWAPLGTPLPIRTTLNGAFVAAIKDPAVAEFIRNTAYDPDGSTPDEQTLMSQAELRYWEDAVKLAHYEPQ